jgi:hypothetical protein
MALEPVVDALENTLASVGGRAPFHSSMQALVATARK